MPTIPLPDIPLVPDDINIPGPGDLLSKPAEAFFDFVNDKAKDFVDFVLDTVEYLIINPLVPKDSELEDYLYGNVLGINGLLISFVMFMVLLIMLFRKRYVVNFMQIVLIAAVVGASGPAWFELASWTTAFGDEISRGVIDIFEAAPQSGGVDLFGDLPPITNVFGSIFITALVLFFGIPLLLVSMAYEVAVILATLLMLPALIMSPLGPRSQKWLNIWISIGIVAALAGGPTMIACFRIGRYLADNANVDNNWLIASIWIVIGMFSALVMQVVLFIVTYRTWTQVSGQVGANVRGNVESTIRQRQASSRAADAHANAMRPSPVQGAQGPSRVRAVRSEVVRQGAMHISARAAGSSHPAIAATVHVAGRAASRKKKPDQGA